METPNLTIGRPAPRQQDEAGYSDALAGAGTAGSAQHTDVGVSSASEAQRTADKHAATAAAPPPELPAGTGWTSKLRAWITGHDLLRLTPPWTTWPDYNQVRGEA
jgi:hypothetical protein